MCYITATEFKNNLSHYMTLSSTEDVYVTKNNRVVTVLISPKKKALERLLSLEGVLQNDGSNPSDLIAEEILNHAYSR
ncbi:MAG: type II toxin-antitoxin system Phd/YefM family antitoxin [Bacilli bacterium]|nr:type II toxin-antitoxin system Phd/YefM family antitoxin [Bacilli bacterium]